MIKGYIDKGWINGVVTLVIHDGHVVQYKGYGYADREAGKRDEAGRSFPDRVVRPRRS